MAVATSLEHLTPSPTWPLWSPMATKALKRVRCPARVCFCTGMIFSTSSFRAGPRKKSMISNSWKDYLIYVLIELRSYQKYSK